MAEQPSAMPFEHRLQGLSAAVARAVHVAATLKIASGPNPHVSSSGGIGRRAKESRGAVVSRAELNAPTATPPEVTDWIRGLGTFYRRIAAGSEPDKDLLMRQLERQVGELTDEISRASDHSAEAIGQFMGRLGGKARVYPQYVEQLERGLRAKVDRAASDLLPERSVHGVLTGLVANRISGSVEDDTLARVGQALQRSPEPARPPAQLAENEAPAPAGALTGPAPTVGPGPLTPSDLDELDVPAAPGALKRLDPAALDAEPRALADLGAPGQDSAAIEPAGVPEPGREIDEPGPSHREHPGLGS